jgi:pimeloyl-ACP methyl ester carboxylesterase
MAAREGEAGGAIDDGRSSAITPFLITEFADEVAELRRRLRSTRWPDRETVASAPTAAERWSQGIPLEVVRELCDYWADGYDWPARLAALNSLDHARTKIDGLDIHFVHLRSSRVDAIPLILTHGWPGSFVEFLEVAKLLAEPPGEEETEPTEHPTPAFHVVIPSLPGFALSDKPTEPGWNAPRIARAWAELMSRLGYDRFIASGSDWGVSVTESIGDHLPQRTLGIHLVPPLAAPDPWSFDDLTATEERALDDAEFRARDGAAYGDLQRTRPQTIGYGLVDSPVALASWIGEKFWQWSDHDGDLLTVIDRDRLLDNLMMYWLPATGASSARLYWEWLDDVDRRLGLPGAEPIVNVPVGGSVFPDEVPRPSRRWASRRFPDIRHWGEPPRGGHFAAMEQPELFADEVRAFARTLDL